MPRPYKDLTGRHFNRLTVAHFSHRDGKKYYWHCICSCGNHSIVERDSMISGKTKSCGCLHREAIGDRMRKHGMSNTGCYHSWHAAMQRCYFVTSRQYVNYGGRGIRVCERWHDYENFHADMFASWFIGATIERKDVNGDYEPSNCIWIPKSEQSKNTRAAVIIDTPWGPLNARYVAQKLGLNHGSMYTRIKYWPRERWLEPKRGQ